MESSGELNGTKNTYPTEVLSQADLNLRAQALEAAADMVVITNTDGVIEYVNDAFCNETGYSRNEIIGSTHHRLNSGHQDAEFYDQLWATVTAGSVWSGELINRRKDGTEYPEEMTITPVKNELGQLTHFIAIKRNIAERKEIFKALATQLKTMSEVRQLKKNAQTRSEFLSLVSHELRAPLTSITAFTSILQKNNLENLTEKQLDFFARINSSAHSLAQIVDDLVDATKGNTSNLSIHPAPFFIDELVNEVVEHLQPTLDSRLQGLTISCPDERVQLQADRHRIEQVLTNLLENASKYSPDGSEIFIKLESSDLELMVSISDQGIGIDDQDLQSLFTPFFRANNPETRKQHGSGLGLYIVKTIVELHHGEVEISSKRNSGTTVQFTLPVAK